MKQIGIGLLFAFLTCGIGIYFFQNFNSSFEDVSCGDCAELHSRPINDISFSKLYENQETLVGQVVRVKVTVANNDKYISISDNLRRNIIDVGYDLTNSWSCCQSAKKKLKKLEYSLMGVVTAESTVVGRLERNLENTNSNFIFKILCVERIF